jgi:hypothetical protein
VTSLARAPVSVAAIKLTADPRPVRPPAHEQLALDVARQPRSLPVQQGPKLERQSRSEVLLITTPDRVQLAQVDHRPIQQADARPVARPAQRQVAAPLYARVALAAAQVQWLPLQGTEPHYVQLLNAARMQGLAARTRNALADRGWRRLAIGNAHNVRQHNLVLYGATRSHVAASLAAQFRCNAVKVAGMRSVIVLLGRDAAGHKPPSYRA